MDLFAEIQKRAEITDHNSNLAGEMTLDVVKDATSQAVGTDAIGSVFDVTITQFVALRTRAEELIVGQLSGMRLAQQAEGAAFLEEAVSAKAFKAIRRRVVTSLEIVRESSSAEDED